ncbi:hypothetical protein SAMN04487948_101384 [Halogranum amylolyticum]|uniref:Uncharacterized protein n=1 Tax=Halogranum amylolyticum TaxID=660520 RepID=A0A1H8N8H7_9EURY|nr:hypothetical protein [Halogranum amylolyticum]SEO25890.1 hypothetical protein SAMN04487948_101384 [Halogranum amylolyticum]
MPSTRSAETPSVTVELLFYVGGLLAIGALLPVLTRWDAVLTVEGLAFLAVGSVVGVAGTWVDDVARVRGYSSPSGRRFAWLFVVSVVGQGLTALVPVAAMSAIVGFLGSMATVRLLQVATGQHS